MPPPLAMKWPRYQQEFLLDQAPAIAPAIMAPPKKVENNVAAIIPPTTSERLGTPSVRNRRPGIVYLTIWPAAINAVATPTTAQPVAVPTLKPHTTMADQTSKAPGRDVYYDRRTRGRSLQALDGCVPGHNGGKLSG